MSKTYVTIQLQLIGLNWMTSYCYTVQQQKLLLWVFVVVMQFYCHTTNHLCLNLWHMKRLSWSFVSTTETNMSAWPYFWLYPRKPEINSINLSCNGFPSKRTVDRKRLSVNNLLISQGDFSRVARYIPRFTLLQIFQTI